MPLRKIVAATLLTGLVASVLAALPALGSRAVTTTVAVRATEFKFVLSKKQVPKGTVVFKVTNKGTIAHDFKINGKKTRLIQPGKSTTLRVVFSRAKRYPYLCTIPGHAGAGMKGTLTVR
jgi:uncharacterized cupredoxin-like copper-binding protein